MGGDNVEQVWFGLCMIKAIIILFVVSLVVLLCWRSLRSILCKSVRRRPLEHPDGPSAWHRAANSKTWRSRSWGPKEAHGMSNCDRL
jgi:hypothetical protein